LFPLENKGNIAMTNEYEDQWPVRFPVDSWVRENRQGAEAAQVIEHRGNMLVLANGKLLHATKAVRA
jgi:hypothetical protein